MKTQRLLLRRLALAVCALLLGAWSLPALALDAIEVQKLLAKDGKTESKSELAFQFEDFGFSRCLWCFSLASSSSPYFSRRKGFAERRFIGAIRFHSLPPASTFDSFFLSVTHDLKNDCCFWKKAQRIFELMSKCGITPVFTDNSGMRREE